MGWWYIVTIVSITFIFVVSVTLCFMYRRNWEIARIFLAAVLLLWSADVCLTECKDITSKCSPLIDFIVLEDLLTIIFLFMRRRLKIIVTVVSAVLAVIFPLIGTIFIFIPSHQDVYRMLAAGSFHTSMCLIIANFANLRK
nr:unnamed protein product [Trichobilharzia regenti]